jgi:E3 ubiquitin-protein ligase DOA10
VSASSTRNSFIESDTSFTLINRLSLITTLSELTTFLLVTLSFFAIADQTQQKETIERRQQKEAIERQLQRKTMKQQLQKETIEQQQETTQQERSNTLFRVNRERSQRQREKSTLNDTDEIINFVIKLLKKNIY